MFDRNLENILEKMRSALLARYSQLKNIDTALLTKLITNANQQMILRASEKGGIYHCPECQIATTDTHNHKCKKHPNKTLMFLCGCCGQKTVCTALKRHRNSEYHQTNSLLVPPTQARSGETLDVVPPTQAQSGETLGEVPPTQPQSVEKPGEVPPTQPSTEKPNVTISSNNFVPGTTLFPSPNGIPFISNGVNFYNLASNFTSFQPVINAQQSIKEDELVRAAKLRKTF